jgi:hypothetical protein
MFLVAAAAIAVSSPQNASPAPTSAAVAQARATVRIVSAARLNWGQEPRISDVPAARTTTIQTVNGPQPAKLIEFE